jgi:drug/metabolite transporter (DMT)-like permease
MFIMNDNFRTIAFTLSALVAFAANSVLCRKALGAATIDAASFTAVRLISGAVVLWALISLRKDRQASNHRGTWLSASMLFLYATAFSFAYLKLSAGTGALILFCSVQLTMILYGLWSGERPHALQWTGLFLALGGLFYLVVPGLAAPSLGGSALMAIAGVGWGVYSLRGRGIKDPAAMTAGNFLRTVPFVIVVSLAMLSQIHVSSVGFLLAFISGSLTSGLGYLVWYAALQGLTATRAATVQLSVPVFAAFGGTIFLSEKISLRLVIATVLIIGGVALTVIGKERLTCTGQTCPRSF